MIDDNTPLSLDSELRLSPHRLTLGKSELLTDAITLPFTDLDSRLNRFAIQQQPEDRKGLISAMKSYLGRLNANPLLPLSFRLKVLDRFEKELDLFDGEMTAAVLNAHKIAVEMVQHEARKDRSYYAPLVEMCSSAIELAARMLELTVTTYQAIPVIATRQFFELARLGLEVADMLDETLSSKVKRLTTEICRHELLRALDFYSKSHEQQQLIINELSNHATAYEAEFVRRDTPLHTNRLTLMSNFNRPNDPPKVMKGIEGSLPFDAILMPVDRLLERVMTALKHVKTLQQNLDDQKRELHTEEAIHATLIAGEAIAQALNDHPDRENRQAAPELHLNIEWRADHAIRNSTKSNQDQQSSDFNWHLLNIGKHGACIEKLNSSVTHEVDALIGLCWNSERTLPKLAIVRWMKESKHAESRIGIDFFSDSFKIVHAGIESGSEAMNEMRSWPLIVIPGKGALTAYFPETRIYRNMVFSIRSSSEKLYFKVIEVTHQGSNYAIATIARARLR